MMIDQFQRIMEDENIPVFGVGPAASMADEKPGHRPGDLLPGVQSLISFGIPVPNGVYQIASKDIEMIWRS
jgi:hypothetical protein